MPAGHRGDQQADIEGRHQGNDDQAGNGAQGRAVHGLPNRTNEADLDAFDLEAGCRYFEDPGQQQNQEQIDVVSAQASSQRHAYRNQKFGGAKALPDDQQPVGREVRLWRENLREIVTLELPHTGPVEIEEAISPRLYPEQQQDQQHGEQQHPVMRRGRRQRYGQHGCDDRQCPIARPVQPVAPPRHAGNLGAMKVRHRCDEFPGRKRSSYGFRGHQCICHDHTSTPAPRTV